MSKNHILQAEYDSRHKAKSASICYSVKYELVFQYINQHTSALVFIAFVPAAEQRGLKSMLSTPLESNDLQNSNDSGAVKGSLVRYKIIWILLFICILP